MPDHLFILCVSMKPWALFRAFVLMVCGPLGLASRRQANLKFSLSLPTSLNSGERFLKENVSFDLKEKSYISLSLPPSLPGLHTSLWTPKFWTASWKRCFAAVFGRISLFAGQLFMSPLSMVAQLFIYLLVYFLRDLFCSSQADWFVFDTVY